MKSVQVAIAEYDNKLLQKLAEGISNDTKLNLVGIADNGKDAYEMINSQEIDVMVMELLLPYLDGFAILDRLQEQNKLHRKPKIIMTTTMSNDAIVRESFRRGVDYFIVKPYDAKNIIMRIKQLGNAEEIYGGTENYSLDMDSVISSQLIKLGVPASLKGYRYIILAIKKAIADATVLEGVTKILYPEIARDYNSTPQRVEKDIRHAIEVAWSRNSDSHLKGAFKCATSNGKVRPTNSEFIAVMSQQVKMSL